MTQPTVDDLRDLARRSRREQRRAALAFVGALGFFPAVGFLLGARPEWLVGATYAMTALVGGLVAWYAHAAGQSRGAFRKVFRRLKDERSGAAER